MSTQVLSPAPNRVGLVFLPPVVNRVTFVPDPIVAVDGIGLKINSADNNAIEVYGDLAQSSWNAILSVVGPTIITIIEYWDQEI